MERTSFWRNFLKGIGSLFGWTFDRRSYEERFGTDKERLASDWKKAGEDIKFAADTLIGRIYTKEEKRNEDRNF